MDLIAEYNKILHTKGYVQILSDELHLSLRINNKLRRYNRYASKGNKINLKSKFKVKNEETDELIELLQLQQKFKDNNIREPEINKKKNFIKKEIEKLNPNKNIKLNADVLYDASRVQIERVNSLSDFSNKIKKYSLTSSNIYFRGQKNLNWSILPSVFRKNWIEHERDFIHELFISNSQDFDNLNTTLEKLTKMQHYNAPTRLLDLTTNPIYCIIFRL